MFQKLKFFLFLSLSVSLSHGYSSGAPSDPGICLDLRPRHPYPAQTKPFLYSVTLDKTNISPGQTVEVEIASPKNDPQLKFKGFLVQGRKVDFEKETSPMGRFLIPNEIDLDYKAINCGDTINSTVTHSGPKEKSSVKLTWIVPEEGTYVILTTVAQNGAIFWVRQSSAHLTVA